MLSVTVAIPMYNAAPHLRECLDSVLAQTFRDFELLIVDDGSTDGCVDIVRSYADPRIRLLLNRHDYIGSLNLLLSEARGKYIARMDADDVMVPQRLALQFAYMEAHPDVDLLGGNMVTLGTSDCLYDTSGPSRRVTLQDMLAGCCLVHPTVMFRTATVRAHGLAYEAHGKALAVHFTSNAYLLTPERIERLASLKLHRPISWQITLDGGRAVHNRVRHTVAREATYDTIVRNIHALLQAGMSVLVRLNYQYANLLSFLDVIDDFKDVDEKLKPLLSFQFQQIWQDRNNVSRENVNQELEKIERAYKEAGLPLQTQRTRPTRCYADNEHSIVVNYDGNLFRCTAQDFVPDSREGILSPDGELQVNDTYRKRTARKFTNKVCRACKVYPLCFGGCSQKQMSRFADACVMHYTEEDKLQLIKQRIRALSESFHKQN